MYFERTRLSRAVVFAIYLLSPMWANAQDRQTLFETIEQTIAQSHPEWTLTNKSPNPNPQYKVITYRWGRDRDEILAWMIEEQSSDDAARTFYRLASLPAGQPPSQLQIGDKCYIVNRSPDNVTLWLRKGTLVVKLAGGDSVGRQRAVPEVMVRFAQEIASVVPSIPGNISRSTESFKEPLRLRPDRAQAHYELGQSYYETGDYKAAATSLEEALRLQPDFFEALVLLAKSYQHAGLYASAVSVLQKAVLLQPTNLDVRTSLGTALILAGQPQDAIAVLEEVARLSPASALVYTHLGQAYRLTGKFQEALNAFTQALRINPQDPVVHNWLGLTYESLERKQEALAAYKRAIELKPDYAEAHYNLGVLCLILGDRAQAEQEYSILKNLNSDLAQVLSTKLRQPDPL
jgi:Flp pilus assembly protein TadD